LKIKLLGGIVKMYGGDCIKKERAFEKPKAPSNPNQPKESLYVQVHSQIYEPGPTENASLKIALKK
jgi:hypothetical protein